MIKLKNKLLSTIIALTSIISVLPDSALVAEGAPASSVTMAPSGTPSGVPDSGASKKPTLTPRPTLSPEDARIHEKILKGLSKFQFKPYEWSETLNVGDLSYAIAENIYFMYTKKDKTGKDRLWAGTEMEKESKNFYSSTDWHKFTGMEDTVEISNMCKAILSEEVQVYEELMDKAAAKYGITAYKEIFKAIGQTRYIEQKEVYDGLKSRGKIHGKGDDLFDLYKINGSWIDGGKTPVEGAKAPTPKPTQAPQPTRMPGQSPTPMPNDTDGSLFDELYGTSNFTVAQSIELAAKTFSDIITNAAYPSPYSTDTLMGAVQAFEFGGNSISIKERYKSSPCQIKELSGFLPFEQYYYPEAARIKALEKEESDKTGETETNKDDLDYDKIIEKYAKAIAHDKTRPSGDVETYGKYKYSDQKFYQKVFENYQCTGGGTIDYGNLPPEMVEILRQCIKTWDSRVTKERREIIQQGILLYGVTYSMDYRNRPSVDKPEYLDCSSFVGQAYWRAGLLDKGAAHWCTGTFADKFQHISAESLIPGDIAQKCWNPGGSGASEHIGIYIGTVGGTKYYLHCASDGVHPKGKGVRINNYGGFVEFGRMPGL